VRVRHCFHPKRGPSAEVPYREEERWITLSDGRRIRHSVKIYARVPGNGVEQQVKPLCLSERIKWDPRRGVKSTR